MKRCLIRLGPEQIDAFGIGNGISLLIMAGIWDEWNDVLDAYFDAWYHAERAQ